MHMTSKTRQPSLTVPDTKYRAVDAYITLLEAKLADFRQTTDLAFLRQETGEQAFAMANFRDELRDVERATYVPSSIQRDLDEVSAQIGREYDEAFRRSGRAFERAMRELRGCVGASDVQVLEQRLTSATKALADLVEIKLRPAKAFRDELCRMPEGETPGRRPKRRRGRPKDETKAERNRRIFEEWQQWKQDNPGGTMAAFARARVPYLKVDTVRKILNREAAKAKSRR